jgi:tRNA (cmo5U34)-methyltransferase
MAQEHRVAGHLGVAADDYDRTILTFIPNYERMIATIVRWLDGVVPAGGLVVDLGAGTGSLSAAVLEGLRDARLHLVDIDPNMLEVAAARCAPYADRIELRHASFADPLPRCHAVVALLALHHVPTHDVKREVYRAILDALEPGGVVASGDLFVHEDGIARELMVRALYEHMDRHGIDNDRAGEYLAQWAEEDHYVSLPDELGLMSAAGFARPDCFWREGGFAVVGAFKD